jgi:hypothetical protein
LVIFSVKKSLNVSAMLHVNRFLQIFSPSTIMSKLPSIFLRQDYIYKTSFFVKCMLDFFQYMIVEPSDNDISETNS